MEQRRNAKDLSQSLSRGEGIRGAVAAEIEAVHTHASASGGHKNCCGGGEANIVGAENFLPLRKGITTPAFGVPFTLKGNKCAVGAAIGDDADVRVGGFSLMQYLTALLIFFLTSPWAYAYGYRQPAPNGA